MLLLFFLSFYIPNNPVQMRWCVCVFVLSRPQRNEEENRKRLSICEIANRWPSCIMDLLCSAFCFYFRFSVIGILYFFAFLLEGKKQLVLIGFSWRSISSLLFSPTSLRLYLVGKSEGVAPIARPLISYAPPLSLYLLTFADSRSNTKKKMNTYNMVSWAYHTQYWSCRQCCRHTLPLGPALRLFKLKSRILSH